MSSSNKMDFLPDGVSFLPLEWRHLGGAFATKDDSCISLSNRCSFVVREGFDKIDKSSTGRVLDGVAELGATLRKKSLALSLSVGGLSWFSGLDDPTATSTFQNPTLKASVAKEFKEDQFVALSYDFRLQKPEVSVCWTGESFTEKATLCLHADPLYKTYRLGAAVELPGPEWRDIVYDDETDRIEHPYDDGSRHKMWIQHTMKDRNWMHSTRAGIIMDLGRMANYVANYIDYRVEPHIPPLYWHLPFSQTLYNFLVPAEDSNQLHHHINNWDLALSHDFAQKAPKLALSKHLKYASLSASYDMNFKEAGVEYARKGMG
eukprot:gene27109-2334_t